MSDTNKGTKITLHWYIPVIFPIPLAALPLILKGIKQVKPIPLPKHRLAP